MTLYLSILNKKWFFLIGFFLLLFLAINILMAGKSVNRNDINKEPLAKLIHSKSKISTPTVLPSITSARQIEYIAGTSGTLLTPTIEVKKEIIETAASTSNTQTQSQTNNQETTQQHTPTSTPMILPTNKPKLTPTDAPTPTAIPVVYNSWVRGHFVDENGNETEIPGMQITLFIEDGPFVVETSSSYWEYTNVPYGNLRVIVKPVDGYSIQHMVDFMSLDTDRYFDSPTFGVGIHENSNVGITIKYSRVN